MSILLAFLLALPAQAQDDPVERQTLRLKEQLKLTDEQTEKMRGLLKKQNEDLRGALTEEQKTRYDELARGGGQGRTFNRGAGGNFGGFGSGLPTVEELKKQLTLTDEQVTKFNEVRDGIREQIRTFWQNRQRGGNAMEEWQTLQQKIKDESVKKVKEFLTEAQKPKFDELLKNLTPRPEPTTGARSFPQLPEERLNRAMEALKVDNEDEAKEIKEALKKVVDALDKTETYEREAKGKIDELARNKELSDEALDDKISELRKGLRTLEKDLGTARKQLGEIITARQELELIRRGILK